MLRPVLLGVLVGLFPIVVLLLATAGLVPASELVAESVGSGGSGGAEQAVIVAGIRSRERLSAAIGPGFWVHGLPLLPTRPIRSGEDPEAPLGQPENEELTAEQIAAVEAAALAEVQREAADPDEVRRSGSLGAAVPASVRRWEQIIGRSAERHGLDPNLVAALIMTESGGDPAAVSPKGAIGLMQVMGGSLDPGANVEQGCAILARNLARYGKLDLALAAYNAGPGAVDRYGGIPPYRETRDLVFRVLFRLELYTA